MPVHPNVKRCKHTRIDGQPCGGAALKGRPHCRFHDQFMRPGKRFALLPLEDSSSIQLTIMEVIRSLIEGRMDRQKANTVLYALQIAQNNLKGLKMVADANAESLDDARQESLVETLLKSLDDTIDDPPPGPKKSLVDEPWNDPRYTEGEKQLFRENSLPEDPNDVGK